MKTLLLDQSTWDLVIDSAGNIAVASDPYALAQDAASAIKLFLGELWYDTTKGVPYFSTILGRAPPSTLLQAKFQKAALSVPGVTAARVIISSINGRSVSGQVQVTNATGSTATATF
jgi:hypothetical protein